jgi:DNA-directed RNA polymerase specialized sigma24 family protein
MLGVPANTVKTHLHRARGKLAMTLGARRALEEQGT